jgi:hypothetical protein
MPSARRGAIRAPLLAILVGLLAACGGNAASTAPSASSAAVAPSATATPAATPEPSPTETAEPTATLATTGRIAVPDHGFAITLPDGWTRVDLEGDMLEAILDAAGDMNPDLAEAYSNQMRALIEQGMVVFAFGPDLSAGQNINVLATKAGPVTLDLVDVLNETQLKQVAKDGSLKSDRVKLPAGEAIRYIYGIDMGTAGTANVHQYMTIVDDELVVVTVTASDLETATEIANSIESLD